MILANKYVTFFVIQKAYFHIKLKPLFQVQNSMEKHKKVFNRILCPCTFFLNEMVYKKNVNNL